MSLVREIDIIVNAPITEAAVRTIVMRGAQLNFIYLDENAGASPACIKQYWSPDEAVKYVMKKWEGGIAGSLTVKFQDTYFWLFFGETQGYMSMLLTPAAAYWYKDRYVDFDRYIRLLLDLCSDFSIIGLKTYDSDIDEQ